MLRYSYLFLYILGLPVPRFWPGRSPGSLQELSTAVFFQAVLCRIAFGKVRARLCSADHFLTFKGSYCQMCSNHPSFFMSMCNPHCTKHVCADLPPVHAECLWSLCDCVCQSLPDISAWCVLLWWDGKGAKPEWLQASHCEVWWR